MVVGEVFEVGGFQFSHGGTDSLILGQPRVKTLTIFIRTLDTLICFVIKRNDSIIIIICNSNK